MPRLVDDQRHKFYNDELFRKLSRESEIRYTGQRGASLDERRAALVTHCRQGHVDVVFVSCGINLSLFFPPVDSCTSVQSECADFSRDPDKVYLRSQFILNGVSVVWTGWLDLRRLDGTARLQLDDDSGVQHLAHS